jgi:hypothetical protein
MDPPTTLAREFCSKAKLPRLFFVLWDLPALAREYAIISVSAN